jgi:glycolate oxidase FAD binding subunit
MGTLYPATPDELSASLAKLAKSKTRIQSGGAFTKNEWGGPVTEPDVYFSTSRLNRLLQYEPNDLTVSVEAGMKWSALLDLLSANNQTVPLDPPYANDATVGGVVSANCCGPRRRLYGSARDHVIGLKFATLQGKLVDSGGMVVKNVAGLDMGKLMIGSFGTLAVLASVNFKVTPKPQHERTFVFQTSDPEAVLRERDKMLKGVLQPAAIDVLNPAAAKRVGLDGYVLLIQAGGNQKVMERYERELSSWTIVSDAASLWQQIQEFTPNFLAEYKHGAVTKSGKLRGAADFTQAPAVARAGNAVTYTYFADTASATAFAAKSGHGIVECPGGPCGPEHQWPNATNDLAVMLKVKNMFDPDGILNRGRLYGRI